MSINKVECMSYNQIHIPNLGSLKGLSDSRNRIARYIKVPIGSIPRRWEKAVPVEPWDGILDVTAPEVPAENESENEQTSLCTNIFAPVLGSYKGATHSQKAIASLPVLAIVSKSASDYSNIVEASLEEGKPIIIVKLYHRTGHLGFLASKELAFESQSGAQDSTSNHSKKLDDGSFGNWGLTDIILGLQWIQSYIHGFGGDRSRVTIMGGTNDQAGESAVIYLQHINACRGLFKRSIIHCCGSANFLPHLQPQFEGQMHFDYLCEAFKIQKATPPLEKVERLRKVSEEELARVIKNSPVNFFGPTVDNIIFHESPRVVVGNSSSIVSGLEWVMIGTSTINESNISSFIGAVNLNSFATFKRRICSPSDYDIFDKVYGIPKTNVEAKALAAHVLNRGAFHYSAVQIRNSIITHPTCQLSRYNIDQDFGLLCKPSSNSNGQRSLRRDKWRIQHEKMVRKKVYQAWIEFVTAESADASVLPKMSQDSNDRNLVSVDDVTIVRDVIREMSDEEKKLWRQSFEYYGSPESDHWKKQVKDLTMSSRSSQSVDKENPSISSIFRLSLLLLPSIQISASPSPPTIPQSSPSEPSPSLTSTVLTAVVDFVTFLRF